MVQMRENWATLRGSIAGIGQPGLPNEDWLGLELAVDQVIDDAAYANLLADATGAVVTVRLPVTAVRRLGLEAGDKIAVRARKATPSTVFGDGASLTRLRDAFSPLDIAPLLDGGDRAASVIADLHRACTETGFVVVTGHGIERELDALFRAARAFFDQPQASKEAVPRVDRYGFIPHSASAIDTTRASDRTEYLDLGLHDEIGLPDVPGVDLPGAVRAYQTGALAVGRAIVSALARALGLEADFFATHMTDPQCRLRFLHYPPVERTPDGVLPVPTEPHTDYGLITLLATDGVPGLEVKPIGGETGGDAAGPWTPVPAEAGQLVVNLGDMMARWTNDVYRSTPHRVVGPASGDRISIPFFVNPDPATVIDTIASCITADRPRRYEPVTAGEFLAERIDGAATGADEPYVDRSEGPARTTPDEG